MNLKDSTTTDDLSTNIKVLALLYCIVLLYCIIVENNFKPARKLISHELPVHLLVKLPSPWLKRR